MSTTEITPDHPRSSTAPRCRPPATYALDASHSHVGFSVRHLMVSKTKGRFADVEGTIHIAEDPLESSVEVDIAVASIDTRDETRDGHLRSADFFDAEQPSGASPTAPPRSRRPASDRWTVEGELTVRGRHPPRAARGQPSRVAPRTRGGTSAIGFTAQAELDREAFGLTWNQALETGGVLVGKQVRIEHRGRGRRASRTASSPDLWIGGGEIHLQFTGCSPSGPQAGFLRLRNRARGRGVIGPDMVAVDSRLWWAGRLLGGAAAPSLGGAPRPAPSGPAEKDLREPLTRL